MPADPTPILVAAGWLWRVGVHSLIAGILLFAWARHLELPAGRTRRLLLAAVLVVPLVTASLAGRVPMPLPDGAWFDSARVLALPLGGGLTIAHLAAAAGLLTAAATLLQEIAPSLRRTRPAGGALPLWLGRAARALPGWEACTLHLVAGRRMLVAAGGPPGRPRLDLSPDVLDLLGEDELLAVLRHEHAHHAARRWWALHLLFAARLLQLPNPVALLVFRRTTLELEIACDADAVAGGDPRPLARALLAVYERTDRRDLASRTVLRHRVDVLLGRRPRLDRALPAESLAAAVAVLLVLLPWIV